MRIHKLTVFLFILVVGTLGLTFATRNQTPDNQLTSREALKLQQEKKAKFPVADYEDPELADPRKN